MPRGSTYEERIADLVVAKLEPRLRRLLAEAVQSLRAKAPEADDADDDGPPDVDDEAQEAIRRHWDRWNDARYQRIVALAKPGGAHHFPVVKLACGHTRLLQSKAERSAPESELRGELRDCRLCGDDYERRHPPPTGSGGHHRLLAIVRGLRRRRPR